MLRAVMFSPDFARASHAHDPRWDEKASIQEAYPDLEGNELQIAVFSDYLLDPANPGQHLQLKSASCNELLRRHPSTTATTLHTERSWRQTYSRQA